MRMSRFGRRPLACLVDVVEKGAACWMLTGRVMKIPLPLLTLLLALLLVAPLLLGRLSGRCEPRRADGRRAGKVVARDRCGGSRSRYCTLPQLLSGFKEFHIVAQRLWSTLSVK